VVDVIYVTCTTRNRFWHCALTALSVAQINRRSCFIHVLDDATDDMFQEAKTLMFENMVHRGLIQRYERVPKRIGFCAGRELLVNRFMGESWFTHWFHFDDDILIGPNTIQQAFRDVDGPVLERQGILHVFANPWCDWKPYKGDFAYVSKIGGACYIIPKPIMSKIGNPYAGQGDGEKANARFWRALNRVGVPMFTKWTNPYLCQHTGNVESTIFGHTPSWEAMYAKDFKTDRIVEVPPFRSNELRAAIKSRNLSGYTWRMGTACKIQVKLPAPGSEIGIEIRK